MDISHSEIRCFKSCRRMHYFRYKEGLRPRVEPDALLDGGSYHSKIDSIVKGQAFDVSENPKTTAMAFAFEKYILPDVPMVESEIRFSVPITDEINLVGYVDGKLADGTPVEHKTTSFAIDETYEARLPFDEQIPIYLFAMDTDRMIYTLCKKPTIRLKSGESTEEFAQRCIEWYDVDTKDKVRQFRVFREPREIQSSIYEVLTMARAIRDCTHFYRNPYHCDGFIRCPYESICLNYDPQIEPIGFEKTKKEGKKDGD